MTEISDLDKEELVRSLSYAGLILIAFELVKSLLIKPIKSFYSHTTFGKGMPFKSYQEDVLSRDKNEFQACLLYLRDFMKIIDSNDYSTIQELREHRNDLAHNLPDKPKSLDIESYAPLIERTRKALFKLSNHNTIIELGADPEFQSRVTDWSGLAGEEYFLLEEVLKKINGFLLSQE